VETIRQTQKKYCSRALVVAIFIALGLMLAGYRPLGKGLLLGAVFSSINFAIMGATLPLRIKEGRAKSVLASLLSILVRYLFMAVPIFLAIKDPAYNLVAVVCGLFMVQLMILANPLWDRFSLKQSNL
jgi:hypothetical protein